MDAGASCRPANAGAMELDFADPERRAALKRAAALITDAYQILSEEVGTPNEEYEVGPGRWRIRRT